MDFVANSAAHPLMRRMQSTPARAAAPFIRSSLVFEAGAGGKCSGPGGFGGSRLVEVSHCGTLRRQLGPSASTNAYLAVRFGSLHRRRAHAASSMTKTMTKLHALRRTLRLRYPL